MRGPTQPEAWKVLHRFSVVLSAGASTSATCSGEGDTANRATQVAAVKLLLDTSPLIYASFVGDEDELLEAVTDRLAGGHTVAWHHSPTNVSVHADERQLLLVSPDYHKLVAHGGRVEGDRAFERDLVIPNPFAEPCPASPGEILIPHPAGRLARLLRCFERRTGIEQLVGARVYVDPTRIGTPRSALRAFVRAKCHSVVLEDFIVDRGHLPLAWAHILSAEGSTSDEG